MGIGVSAVVAPATVGVAVADVAVVGVGTCGEDDCAAATASSLSCAVFSWMIAATARSNDDAGVPVVPLASAADAGCAVLTFRIRHVDRSAMAAVDGAKNSGNWGTLKG